MCESKFLHVLDKSKQIQTCKLSKKSLTLVAISPEVHGRFQSSWTF